MLGKVKLFFANSRSNGWTSRSSTCCNIARGDNHYGV